MKEYISSVSPKGQITLPIEFRKQLGIKPKDQVAVTLDDDGVKITPVGARLTESFRAIPALRKARTLGEMTRLAHEEHAQHVASEGL